MKLTATVQIPLYDPGYTMPDELQGISFDPYGLSPAVIRATGPSLTNAPPNVLGAIPQVGLLATVSIGTLGAGNYPQISWANGYAMVPLGAPGSPTQLAYMPFSSQVAAEQTTFQALNYPLPDVGFGVTLAAQNFAPPLGESVVERKYGGWGLEFLNPVVTPPPGTNICTVLIFEYGGSKFQGFGIQMGGNDPTQQWGFATFLVGTSPINNGFLDPAANQSQNYTYFNDNGSPRGPIVVAWIGQEFSNPDYFYRNGQIFNVSFDDPILQAAYSVGGFVELSCTRNGWTAILQVDDYMFPGSKWAFIFMDYPMQNYYLLKCVPVAPGSGGSLTQSVTPPSFKIDQDGISWLLDNRAGGAIWTSFSENLAFDPAIYPVPAATFSLPCFDPCSPDLWESQIAATEFKSPVLGG